MSSETESVIITSIREKLPSDVQGLLNDSVPLPAGVNFFETKRNISSLLNTLLIGVALLGIGVVVTFFGAHILAWSAERPSIGTQVEYKPIIVGLVLLFAGGMFLRSLPAKRRLMLEQAAGKPTRFGIYLLPGRLVCHSDFDTTLIPKTYYRGLDGNAIRYELNAQPKSFNVPSEIVGYSVEDLKQAIRSWEAGA